MKVYHLVFFDPDCGEIDFGFYASRQSAVKRLKEIEKEKLQPGNHFDEEEYEIRAISVKK